MKNQNHTTKFVGLAALIGALALGGLAGGCAATPTKDSTGEYVDDATVTTKVKSALLGDGALSYGPEVLGEIYYRLGITSAISIIGTYQPVFNPGYNNVRGPVNIFTGRAHMNF